MKIKWDNECKALKKKHLIFAISTNKIILGVEISALDCYD